MEYADNAKAAKTPFANHDATRNVAKRIGGPPLAELTERLFTLNARINSDLLGTAGLLNEHADRVHGPPVLRDASDEQCHAPTRDHGAGQLGDLYRALDMVEASFATASSAVAFAAGRNSTLA